MVQTQDMMARADKVTVEMGTCSYKMNDGIDDVTNGELL